MKSKLFLTKKLFPENWPIFLPGATQPFFSCETRVCKPIVTDLHV